MVIDEKELITENQNKQEVKSQILNTKESLKNEDFDLTSKKYNKYSENTSQYETSDVNFSSMPADITEECNESPIYKEEHYDYMLDSNVDQQRSGENNNQERNDTLDVESSTSEVSTALDTTSEKETVETNCLALTVRKDYNFSIAKNTVFKTIRMSIKVAISTFILNLIKIFF